MIENFQSQVVILFGDTCFGFELSFGLTIAEIYAVRLLIPFHKLSLKKILGETLTSARNKCIIFKIYEIS